MRVRVDALKVAGAPSLTAVVNCGENCIADLEDIAQKVLKVLQKQNIVFSKLAIVYKNIDKYNFKFYQIKNGYLIDNLNCGNSMIAAAIAVQNKTLSNCVSVYNIDTLMEVEVISDIERHTSYSVVINSLINLRYTDTFIEEKEIYDESENKLIRYTYLDIANPYILIKAHELGIENSTELLHLSKKKCPFIYDRTERIRQKIAQSLGYSHNNGLPKIAIYIIENNSIVARTIYLNNWHNGLPVTCMITMGVYYLRKKCIDSNYEVINMISPEGKHRIKFAISNYSITECIIMDFVIGERLSPYIFEL